MCLSYWDSPSKTLLQKKGRRYANKTKHVKTRSKTCSSIQNVDPTFSVTRGILRLTDCKTRAETSSDSSGYQEKEILEKFPSSSPEAAGLKTLRSSEDKTFRNRKTRKILSWTPYLFYFYPGQTNIPFNSPQATT